MQAGNTVRRELPNWLWLWFPILILVLLAVSLFFDYDLTRKLIGEEGGLIELATPIILLPAIYAGIHCYLRHEIFPRNWIIMWLMLVTLACVYFAGEEISWGQQIFGWQTPEFVKDINDQQETNIHNISSWFDQKPRLLLELWIIIGGIILPVWRCVMKINYTNKDWQYWFWPRFVCLPVAVIAVLIKVPEHIKAIFDLSPYAIEIRYAELQEFYFAFFLFLYLYSVKRRLDI